VAAAAVRVRRMVASDVATVRAVEVRAGARFRSVVEPRIARCADAEPYSVDELTGFIERERAWVMTDGGAVAGFVVVDIVDGCAHVEEVAVAPEFGRRGHGAALLGAVDEWARSSGLAAVTLTTFRDVPWNGPWYARLGFRVLDDRELSPALRALRDAEDAHGLPAELRVVMRRDVVPADQERPAGRALPADPNA
jgi:ribosomal protein S18 acetylase RimI-like enzyme